LLLNSEDHKLLFGLASDTILGLDTGEFIIDSGATAPADTIIDCGSESQSDS